MSIAASLTDQPASSTVEPVLVARDLHAGYLPGINILNGVNIEARPGELIGIIGPNGAGKSTFLKAVFGQVSIRQGTVTLKGTDITGWRPNRLVREGVGFVPQTNNVFPSLTIEENMQMGIYQKPKEFREALDRIFEIFPVLADRRQQRAGSLSGGERQSVAMARALMMNPSVLLLDEPSAGLSPVRQDETFIRTRRINKAGVSVIMVEQNARRCLQICDRAYVLDQGRDAYTGTGRELANDPKVIQLYLGTLAADVDAETKSHDAIVDAAAAAAAPAYEYPASDEPTPDEQLPSEPVEASTAAEDLPPSQEPMSDPGVEPDAKGDHD